MNTSVIVILAAGVAVIGRWSQGKSLDGWKMGGGLLLLVILIMLGDYFMPEVAKPMAALVLVASLITYGGPLLMKVTSKGLGAGAEKP
jgi:hypothetical protein